MAANNTASSHFLQPVRPDSGEGQQILLCIRATYLDKQYRTSLDFQDLKIVRNEVLAQKFQRKKRQLYLLGGNDLAQEMYVFACFKKETSVTDIIKEGAMVKPSLYNYLGKSEFGVNLCRHADVQLKSAESGRSNVQRCWLVVFKVLPGRTQVVTPDEKTPYPTLGYDSHVSNVRTLHTEPLNIQAINAQIYLYEFLEEQSNHIAKYPSNILPYAVLTFVKKDKTPLQNPSVPQHQQQQDAPQSTAAQIPPQMQGPSNIVPAHQAPRQKHAAAQGAGAAATNVRQGPPPQAHSQVDNATRQHVQMQQMGYSLPPGQVQPSDLHSSTLQGQRSVHHHTANQVPSSSGFHPAFRYATPMDGTGLGYSYQPNMSAVAAASSIQQIAAAAAASQLPYTADNTPSFQQTLSALHSSLNQSSRGTAAQNIGSSTVNYRAQPTSQTVAHSGRVSSHQSQQQQQQQQQHQQQQHQQQHQVHVGNSNRQQHQPSPTLSNIARSESSVTNRPASAGMGMKLPIIVASSTNSNNSSSITASTGLNQTQSARLVSGISSVPRSSSADSNRSNASSIAAPPPLPPPPYGQVITIQPEGTAPHEDPSFQGVWPWVSVVKKEPTTSGYQEAHSSDNPYAYTRNLMQGGAEHTPIVIEPEEDYLPPNTGRSENITAQSLSAAPLDLSGGQGGGVRNQVLSNVEATSALSGPSGTAGRASPGQTRMRRKNPSPHRVRHHPIVSDRDEFQRLYGSESAQVSTSADSITNSQVTNNLPVTTPATAKGIAQQSSSVVAGTTLEQVNQNAINTTRTPILHVPGTGKPVSRVNVSSTWSVPVGQNTLTPSDLIPTTSAVTQAESVISVGNRVSNLSVENENSRERHTMRSRDDDMSELNTENSSYRQESYNIGTYSSILPQDEGSSSSNNRLQCMDISASGSNSGIGIPASSNITSSSSLPSSLAISSSNTCTAEPAYSYVSTSVTSVVTAVMSTTPVTTSVHTTVSSSRNKMHGVALSTTTLSAIPGREDVPINTNNIIGKITQSVLHNRIVSDVTEAHILATASSSSTSALTSSDGNNTVLSNNNITGTLFEPSDTNAEASAESADANPIIATLLESRDKGTGLNTNKLIIAATSDENVASQSGNKVNSNHHMLASSKGSFKPDASDKTVRSVITGTMKLDSILGKAELKKSSNVNSSTEQNIASKPSSVASTAGAYSIERKINATTKKEPSDTRASKIESTIEQSRRKSDNSDAMKRAFKRTDSVASFTSTESEQTQKHRKKKVTPLAESPAPVSETSQKIQPDISDMKKVSEKQKVVVAADGTIQFVIETVYRDITNQKPSTAKPKLKRQRHTKVPKVPHQQEERVPFQQEQTIVVKEKKEKQAMKIKTVNFSEDYKQGKGKTESYGREGVSIPPKKSPVSKKSGTSVPKLILKPQKARRAFAKKSSTKFPGNLFPRPTVTPGDRISGTYSSSGGTRTQLSFGVLKDSVGIGSISVGSEVVSEQQKNTQYSDTTPKQIKPSFSDYNVKECSVVLADISKLLEKFDLYDINAYHSPPTSDEQVEIQPLETMDSELNLRISSVTSLVSASEENGQLEKPVSATEGNNDISLKENTGKKKQNEALDTDETETDKGSVKGATTKSKKKKKKTKKKSKEKGSKEIIYSDISDADGNEVEYEKETVSIADALKITLKLRDRSSKKQEAAAPVVTESDSDFIGHKSKKRRNRILSRPFIESSDSEMDNRSTKVVSPIKLVKQKSNFSNDQDFKVVSKVSPVKDSDKTSEHKTSTVTTLIPSSDELQQVHTKDIIEGDCIVVSEGDMSDKKSENAESKFVKEHKSDSNPNDLPDVVLSSKVYEHATTVGWTDSQGKSIPDVETKMSIHGPSIEDVESFIKSCRAEEDRKSKDGEGLKGSMTRKENSEKRRDRKRTRSRSRTPEKYRSRSNYSRSPRHYRSRRSHSRSPSPYYRRKRSRYGSPRRRSRSYSRSPPRSRSRRSRSTSPRGRHSRRSRSISPRSPRRYRRSRSPSVHRYRRSRSCSRSPRRIRGSRSVSPRSPKRSRRSKSLSPMRYSPRKSSPTRKPSRSQSPDGKNAGSLDRTLDSQGSRPYSPSSPTASPTKELSLKKHGNPSVDHLFDIAYGKVPAIGVTCDPIVLSGIPIPPPIPPVKNAVKSDLLETAVANSDSVKKTTPKQVVEQPQTAQSDSSSVEKGPKSKLSFTQYKKRHGKGALNSSTEAEDNQTKGKNKANRHASSEDGDEDDELATLQDKYNSIKTALDAYSSEDEDKLDLTIDYKRVGEQLKQLKGKQTGPSMPNPLETLKQASNKNVTSSNLASGSSISDTAASSLKHSFSNVSLSERPEWDINSFDPEGSKQPERFDAYNPDYHGRQDNASKPSHAASEVNVNALLYNLKGIKETLALPPPAVPSTTVTQDVQTLLKIARAQSKPGDAPSNSLPPQPNTESVLNPQRSLTKSSSVPYENNSEQPAFFTGIHSAGPMKNVQPGTHQLSRQSSASSVRDPRLLRRGGSETPGISGHSPRADHSRMSPRSSSGGPGLSGLGISSPPQLSSQQYQNQQQQSGQTSNVYNPAHISHGPSHIPSYNPRLHDSLTPTQQPQLVNPPGNYYQQPSYTQGQHSPEQMDIDSPTPEPLILIPIDEPPEISYEGLVGSIYDPRFLPRDHQEGWNEVVTTSGNREPMMKPKIFLWEEEEEIPVDELLDEAMNINSKRTDRRNVEGPSNSIAESVAKKYVAVARSTSLQMGDSASTSVVSEKTGDEAFSSVRSSFEEFRQKKEMENKMKDQPKKTPVVKEHSGNGQVIVKVPNSDKVVDSKIKEPVVSGSVEENSKDISLPVGPLPAMGFYTQVGSVDNESVEDNLAEDMKRFTVEHATENKDSKNDVKTSKMSEVVKAELTTSVIKPEITTIKKEKSLIVKVKTEYSSSSQVSPRIALASTASASAASQLPSRSQMSVAADNIGEQPLCSSLTIGSADREIISLIKAVESLSGTKLDQMASELKMQLEETLRSVVQENLFTDPTEGITPENRKKLLEDEKVDPAVLTELRTEEHIAKLEELIADLQKSVENLRLKVQLANCPEKTVASFKSQEERLHSVELAREHEYKRLENTMKRYQKAKCVELVPSEFRLATEVDKYISEEGCLLFLTEPLSLADCQNLYCYKVEIEKSKKKLDELNGRDITEVRRCRMEIGYWHSQRRLLLIKMCVVNMARKQYVLEKFREKLDWYRVVQRELEEKGSQRNSTQEIMLQFAVVRIENLERYVSILSDVQLTRNVWEKKETDASPATPRIATANAAVAVPSCGISANNMKTSPGKAHSTVVSAEASTSNKTISVANSEKNSNRSSFAASVAIEVEKCASEKSGDPSSKNDASAEVEVDYSASEVVSDFGTADVENHEDEVAVDEKQGSQDLNTLCDEKDSIPDAKYIKDGIDKQKPDCKKVLSTTSSDSVNKVKGIEVKTPKQTLVTSKSEDIQRKTGLESSHSKSASIKSVDKTKQEKTKHSDKKSSSSSHSKSSVLEKEKSVDKDTDKKSSSSHSKSSVLEKEKSVDKDTDKKSSSSHSKSSVLEKEKSVEKDTDKKSSSSHSKSSEFEKEKSIEKDKSIAEKKILSDKSSGKDGKVGKEHRSKVPEKKGYDKEKSSSKKSSLVIDEKVEKKSKEGSGKNIRRDKDKHVDKKSMEKASKSSSPSSSDEKHSKSDDKKGGKDKHVDKKSMEKASKNSSSSSSDEKHSKGDEKNGEKNRHEHRKIEKQKSQKGHSHSSKALIDKEGTSGHIKLKDPDKSKSATSNVEVKKDKPQHTTDKVPAGKSQLTKIKTTKESEKVDTSMSDAIAKVDLVKKARSDLASGQKGDKQSLDKHDEKGDQPHHHLQPSSKKHDSDKTDNKKTKSERLSKESSGSISSSSSKKDDGGSSLKKTKSKRESDSKSSKKKTSLFDIENAKKSSKLSPNKGLFNTSSSGASQCKKLKLKRDNVSLVEFESDFDEKVDSSSKVEKANKGKEKEATGSSSERECKVLDYEEFIASTSHHKKSRTRNSKMRSKDKQKSVPHQKAEIEVFSMMTQLGPKRRVWIKVPHVSAANDIFKESVPADTCDGLGFKKYVKSKLSVSSVDSSSDHDYQLHASKLKKRKNFVLSDSDNGEVVQKKRTKMQRRRNNIIESDSSDDDDDRKVNSKPALPVIKASEMLRCKKLKMLVKIPLIDVLTQVDKAGSISSRGKTIKIINLFSPYRPPRTRHFKNGEKVKSHKKSLKHHHSKSKNINAQSPLRKNLFETVIPAAELKKSNSGVIKTMSNNNVDAAPVTTTGVSVPKPSVIESGVKKLLTVVDNSKNKLLSSAAKSSRSDVLSVEKAFSKDTNTASKLKSNVNKGDVDNVAASKVFPKSKTSVGNVTSNQNLNKVEKTTALVPTSTTAENKTITVANSSGLVPTSSISVNKTVTTVNTPVLSTSSVTTSSNASKSTDTTRTVAGATPSALYTTSVKRPLPSTNNTVARDSKMTPEYSNTSVDVEPTTRETIGVMHATTKTTTDSKTVKAVISTSTMSKAQNSPVVSTSTISKAQNVSVTSSSTISKAQNIPVTSACTISKAQNVPVTSSSTISKTQNVPVTSACTISKAQNVPVTSACTISKAQNVPVTSSSTISKAQNVPVTSACTISKAQNVPVTSACTISKAQNVPVTSSSTISKAQNVPVTSACTISKAQNLPVTSACTISKAQNLPVTSSATISKTQNVPVTSSSTISKAQNVPVTSTSTISKAQNVPVTSTSTISKAQIVPVAASSTISKAQIVPVASSSTISKAQIVPVASSSTISKAQIVPVASSSTISKAQIVPVASSSTISKTQNVPVVSTSAINLTGVSNTIVPQKDTIQNVNQATIAKTIRISTTQQTLDKKESSENSLSQVKSDNSGNTSTVDCFGDKKVPSTELSITISSNTTLKASATQQSKTNLKSPVQVVASSCATKTSPVSKRVMAIPSIASQLTKRRIQLQDEKAPGNDSVVKPSETLKKDGDLVKEVNINQGIERGGDGKEELSITIRPGHKRNRSVSVDSCVAFEPVKKQIKLTSDSCTSKDDSKYDTHSEGHRRPSGLKLGSGGGSKSSETSTTYSDVSERYENRNVERLKLQSDRNRSTSPAEQRRRRSLEDQDERSKSRASLKDQDERSRIDHFTKYGRPSRNAHNSPVREYASDRSYSPKQVTDNSSRKFRDRSPYSHRPRTPDSIKSPTRSSREASSKRWSPTRRQSPTRRLSPGLSRNLNQRQSPTRRLSPGPSRKLDQRQSPTRRLSSGPSMKLDQRQSPTRRLSPGPSKRLDQRQSPPRRLSPGPSRKLDQRQSPTRRLSPGTSRKSDQRQSPTRRLSPGPSRRLDQRQSPTRRLSPGPKRRRSVEIGDGSRTRSRTPPFRKNFPDGKQPDHSKRSRSPPFNARISSRVETIKQEDIKIEVRSRTSPFKDEQQKKEHSPITWTNSTVETNATRPRSKSNERGGSGSSGGRRSPFLRRSPRRAASPPEEDMETGRNVEAKRGRGRGRGRGSKGELTSPRGRGGRGSGRREVSPLVSPLMESESERRPGSPPRRDLRNTLRESTTRARQPRGRGRPNFASTSSHSSFRSRGGDERSDSRVSDGERGRSSHRSGDAALFSRNQDDRGFNSPPSAGRGNSWGRTPPSRLGDGGGGGRVGGGGGGGGSGHHTSHGERFEQSVNEIKDLMSNTEIQQGDLSETTVRGLLNNLQDQERIRRRGIRDEYPYQERRGPFNRRSNNNNNNSISNVMNNMHGQQECNVGGMRGGISGVQDVQEQEMLRQRQLMQQQQQQQQQQRQQQQHLIEIELQQLRQQQMRNQQLLQQQQQNLSPLMGNRFEMPQRGVMFNNNNNGDGGRGNNGRMGSNFRDQRF